MKRSSSKKLSEPSNTDVNRQKLQSKERDSKNSLSSQKPSKISLRDVMKEIMDELLETGPTKRRNKELKNKMIPLDRRHSPTRRGGMRQGHHTSGGDGPHGHRPDRSEFSDTELRANPSRKGNELPFSGDVFQHRQDIAQGRPVLPTHSKNPRLASRNPRITRAGYDSVSYSAQQMARGEDDVQAHITRPRTWQSRRSGEYEFDPVQSREYPIKAPDPRNPARLPDSGAKMGQSSPLVPPRTTYIGPHTKHRTPQGLEILRKHGRVAPGGRFYGPPGSDPTADNYDKSAYLGREDNGIFYPNPNLPNSTAPTVTLPRSSRPTTRVRVKEGEEELNNQTHRHKSFNKKLDNSQKSSKISLKNMMDEMISDALENDSEVYDLEKNNVNQTKSKTSTSKEAQEILDKGGEVKPGDRYYLNGIYQGRDINNVWHPMKKERRVREIKLMEKMDRRGYSRELMTDVMRHHIKTRCK